MILSACAIGGHSSSTPGAALASIPTGTEDPSIKRTKQQSPPAPEQQRLLIDGFMPPPPVGKHYHLQPTSGDTGNNPKTTRQSVAATRLVCCGYSSMSVGSRRDDRINAHSKNSLWRWLKARTTCEPLFSSPTLRLTPSHAAAMFAHTTNLNTRERERETKTRGGAQGATSVNNSSVPKSQVRLGCLQFSVLYRK